jgi:two-component system OmpR family sensor kinase
VNGVAYLPLIPKIVTGNTVAGDGSAVTYFDANSTASGGPEFRVRASALNNGDVLIVAEPLNDTDSTLHQLFLIELGVTAGAVLMVLAVGFWLVCLGLRPLRHMESTAESIAAGNLTERIPGENDTTEVGRLARMLNMMLTRIEAAFAARLASEQRLRISEQRLRRFVADASHELRTPIAAVSAYAELFGRGASDKKEDLERLIVGIRRETIRMEGLVADLFLLARLDENRVVEYRAVDLVSLCAEAVQTASAVGPEWPLRLVSSAPVNVMGDAVSIRQAIDNLLGNLRAHTPPGTHGTVSVTSDGQTATIQVADNGPGMTASDARQVFERFYRSDPSRSRLHGGAGLGLSIVSAIVTSHGGTVSAEGQPGKGSTFSVGLPIPQPLNSDVEKSPGSIGS